jgi:hypothetical protein
MSCGKMLTNNWLRNLKKILGHIYLLMCWHLHSWYKSNGGWSLVPYLNWGTGIVCTWGIIFLLPHFQNETKPTNKGWFHLRMSLMEQYNILILLISHFGYTLLILCDKVGAPHRILLLGTKLLVWLSWSWTGMGGWGM